MATALIDDDERPDLPEVMETIQRADRGERVTVRERMESVGAKAYGPLLIVPGPVSLLPVPGSGVAAGILAILVALQIVLVRGRLWLPAFLADRSVSRARLMRFPGRIEPRAERASRFVAPRLEVLTAPALVLIVIGLALTAADGVAPIVGYGLAGGAGALAAWSLV